jgi:hypothetical protein
MRSRFVIMSAKLIWACAALALTACSSKPAVPPPTATQATGPDTCGAAPFQDRIGQLLDVVMLQNITASIPSHRVLVLRPDTVASTDVVPERATIKTDKTNLILSITCG